MASLLDKIRSEPRRSPVHVVMGGADPDIEVMGFAYVHADVGGDTPMAIRRITLSCISFLYLKKTGLAQSTKVVEALDREITFHGCTHATIESQQFYPRPDTPRNKMVSVAESLLRIAQVTGALQTQAMKYTKQIVVCLPAEWKAQRSKEVDHMDSLRRCAGVPITCYVNTAGIGKIEDTPDFSQSPGKWEHALDALGIALYGLDLVHTHRWPS